MTNFDREVIHIISQHSNWSQSSVEKALKENVYNGKVSWQKFLEILFIGLGVCFTVAGIIFFFAYNWADLHKFAKIGIVEGLIVVPTLIILFSNISLNIKNIILTGTSVMVGVLFAVFGQIYQTEANAFDLFLGWTLFISLWVFISNFAPLWLIYLTLINTTFILYSQQVAFGWSTIFVFTLLLCLNASFLIFSIVVSTYKPEIKIPVWFSNIVALATVTFATIGIIIGIFDKSQSYFLLLIAIATLLFAAGIFYGLKEKSIFYLSLIPFSLILIISSLFIKISDEKWMYLFTSIFIIACVTLVIKNLIAFQNKWKNE